MEASLGDLRALLPQSNVFEPKHANFNSQSQPWAKQAELHPKLVIQPTSLPDMQKVVKFLYDSKLDFAVRNTGTGSVSAHDVILSMHGFKSFTFDSTSGDESVTIGAGLDWGEVDKLMETNASGYAVVGARCPWVGVAGSTLVGGLSWLSSEFGLISDPQNLLDAQVVLHDGRVVWATSEPDLMWALRGGGGNFGVVTALKLRARPYPRRIFSGVVTVPYSSLVPCSKAVAAMAALPSDPKVAMHVVNQGPGMGMPDQGAKPGIAFILYDANGEEHARSEAFRWLFELEGAQEVAVGEMSLKQIHEIAETFRDYEGTNNLWLSAPLVSEIDDDFLVRAWKWYEESIDQHAGLGIGSTVLLEFMQEKAFGSTESEAATAWPRRGRRHVMQLVLGCRPEGAPSNIRDIAMSRFQAGSIEIPGSGKATGEFHTGFLHEWNDLRQIFGKNFDKLKEIKDRFDPNDRFNKSIQLAGTP